MPIPALCSGAFNPTTRRRHVMERANVEGPAIAGRPDVVLCAKQKTPAWRGSLPAGACASAKGFVQVACVVGTAPHFARPERLFSGCGAGFPAGRLCASTAQEPGQQPVGLLPQLPARVAPRRPDPGSPCSRRTPATRCCITALHERTVSRQKAESSSVGL
jgi:hypothetical protein